MASLFGDIDVGGFFSGAMNVGKGLLIFIILALVVGTVTYLIASRRSFNKHIHIFEEVNKVAVPIGEDLAREITLPHTSTRVFFLKKKKFYLPRPTRQTGKGHYWYFIRQDGEWINIGLENINKDMEELKLDYDHTDMRYANASLKKLVEKNYKKTSWIKEYAPYIALSILVIMIGVAFFLVAWKINQGLGGISGVAEANRQMLETSRDILKSVDNICAGSGLRTVT